VQGGQIFRVNLRVEDMLSNSTNIREQFGIDTTPPDVELKLGTPIFSPDGDGENDIASISLIQKDRKKIGSWKLEIFPVRDGRRESLFRTFSGETLPTQPINWDGLDDSGKELVESAMDYELVLTVKDVLGNTTETRALQSVDILVIKTPYGYQIKISTIGFARDSAVLEGAQNGKILNKVAKILSKYKNYKVEIQGHASKDSAQSGEEYNLKLSENRAKSVVNYLVKQGLAEDQFRAVGRGFGVPLVPNDTEENKAKNRRVEFWLYKDGWPNP
jgi:outer membrane protein OmpA-like peptidoglycan-associated protein